MDYTQYFQTKTRVQSGDKFVCLTGNAPEQLKDFIRQVHFDCFDGCLPNDWIYRTIEEAFEALNNDPIENCTIEADIYDSELIQWLQEPFAKCFCNSFGCEVNDIVEKIRCGQVEAMKEVYIACNQFIQSQA